MNMLTNVEVKPLPRGHIEHLLQRSRDADERSTATWRAADAQAAAIWDRVKAEGPLMVSAMWTAPLIYTRALHRLKPPGGHLLRDWSASTTNAVEVWCLWIEDDEGGIMP